MTRTPEVWLDLREDAHFRALTTVDPEVTLATVVLRPEDISELPAVQRVSRAVFVECEQAISSVPSDVMIVGREESILREATRRGHATGWWTRIADADSMQAAADRGGNHDALIVELADDTNIPLELLLARFQGSKTRVLKCVDTFEDARLACGVLESGCDGVLVRPQAFELLPEFDQWRRSEVTSKVQLSTAEVTEVRSIGMGSRVCVDTVDLLGPEDGMVVGSTAAGGVVVCAEVHPLPYMKLRPFRVNAGALHSYLAAPAGRTAYLSEIAGGDEVLIVSSTGTVRPVVVGRAKMEVRPLLMIVARCGATIIKVALQNDWHVRIFDGDGNARSITTIRPGEAILASTWEGARHVGIGVREQLWEA